MVLDPSQDEFYRKHVFANYGDVAVDVKGLMDQFQSKTEKHKQAGGGEDGGGEEGHEGGGGGGG